MTISPFQIALLVLSSVSVACAQETSQPSIEQRGKFCNQVNTGSGSNNCTIVLPPIDPRKDTGDDSSIAKESSQVEKNKWEKIGLNSNTISSIPVYIYPGVPHDRDGQISEGLKRVLSSKLNFSDKYHAALFLRVVDANVYYNPPSDAEDNPIGFAGFQVDLKWAGGTSLPPIVVGVQTNSIAGSLPRDEALQINAMNLAISQACRKILSMAGGNPREC